MDAATSLISAAPGTALVGLLAEAVTRAESADGASKAPLYQRIGDHIADLVRAGSLPTGTRLPPTRLLAGAVGVHRNTLVRAFAHLESGGWIDATAGRGSFVRAAPSPSTQPAPQPAQARRDAGPLDWARLLSRAATREPLAGLGLASGDHGPLAAEAGALDLASLQPGPSLLPDRDFAASLARTLEAHGPAALGYAPSQGVAELRLALAADLLRLGIRAEPDALVVTTGSQQGLDLLARTLLNPGDVVVTEDATYPGALSIFAAAGAEVRTAGGDADGPRPADLDTIAADVARRGGRLKAVYLVPDARAPLGSRIRLARREAILEWARDAGVPVIEDGYGTDLALDGTEVPPLRALDPGVIHLGTFSKRLLPGLRVGYLVVPPGLLSPLLSLKHAMDLGTSPLLQLALADYLGRGLLAPHLAHLRATLRARRDALVAALCAHLPDTFGVTPPEAGLALWLRLPAGIDATELAVELAREGVLVQPSALGTSPSARRPALRLAFCVEPEARLAEAARILARVVRSRLAARPGGARIGV
jgi:2-aminoadipate transaminase